MKSSLQRLFLLLLLMPAAPARSQTPFEIVDSIDVNNIKAALSVHGELWNDVNGSAKCEFPKGSGKNVISAGALWMGGYANGVQKVSAQKYRAEGVDFWPGPLEFPTVDYPTAQKWARIWKIERWQLDQFLLTPTHTLTNTPQVILEWPAKGNSYATGNNNIPLTLQNYDYAPFVDVDNDGLYDPLAGDYPKMKGDQMLWTIYNDYGPTHTHGVPLQIEIKSAVYAYKRNSAVDNVVFYEYMITNKTQGVIDSFTLGVFSDVDLGASGDDYIGFDSSRYLWC